MVVGWFLEDGALFREADSGVGDDAVDSAGGT